ncbi:MAG: type IV pilin [Methanoregula sp.]|nr:type IV pilin [Methanoregula sp.]
MKTRKYIAGDEHAVSPVVGVMLMVVVVVIIAAIVAGFSGGLIGKVNENAPSLSMDIKVINTGSWTGSGFFATVTQVSKPISTKDIKIITSWSATNRTSYATITGGNTTLPGSANVNAVGDPATLVNLTAPFGAGPGVNGSVSLASSDADAVNLSSRWQQFGNYSLMSGTTLTAQPCGGNLETGAKATIGYGVTNMYQYEPAGTVYADPATAVLGPEWESLRAGDRVNVKVIYVPNGAVIFQKDIAVTEG